MIRKILSVILCSLFISHISHSQTCDDCSSVTSIDVDLSANPDTVWITPQLGRSGQCCHGSGSDVCIRFNITTHPLSRKIGFTLAEPPIPPSMEYGMNCGIPQSVDIPLCINGTGPHCVVYCKPGGDLTRYQITLSRAGYAGPDIAVGDGCSGQIYARGFDLSTIRWNVIYPSSAYNSYLSCLSGCEDVTVTAQPGFPEYVDVEVSGLISGGCSVTPSRDTVRVYFVTDKAVQILPDDATICYGGSSVQISANATGGGPPYNYLWSNGATTQTINVTSPGTYSVTVTDTTTCPAVFDDVYVDQHLSPISVDAGDALVCTTSPQVVLNGLVNEALGGEWIGGNGVFTPSRTSLSGIYTLSADEITNLGTTLTLNSTGNGGCPPASDQMEIVLSPEPIVDAGVDGMVCQTTLEIPLSGQIIGSTSAGVWSTLGSGTFSNTTNLNTTYYPSMADTALGYVRLVLSSVANGACEPVRDTVTIEFGNAPSTNFAFSQPACVGEPILFNDRTTVSWGVVDTYQWNFAGQGTSTVRNPSFAFNAPGTYNVTLRTVTDQGCFNEVTRSVEVSTDPTANFEATSACFGTGIAFTNTSLGATAWNWSFSNGFVSTVENPFGIIYGAEGFYNVTLIATNANGCKDTITKPVEVLPRPVADFQVDNICVSDNVTFTDNSTISSGSIVSWLWDFGDGTRSTVQNPTQSFSTSNPLNIKLVVSSDLCSDSIVRQVTPLESPAFFASPTEGCTPLEVSFFNTVQPNVYYSWNFGDGNMSSLPNPTHMFFNTQDVPVEFEVTLHARSIFGCRDSVKQNVLVYPQSTSAFSVSNAGVCSGGTVSFTNQSVNAVSYLWDFGPDIGQQTDMNPTQTFTNNGRTNIFFPVKLYTSSQYSCYDTAIRYITVYPLPENVITLSADEACHPAIINLTAEPGASTYYWNFGDGTFEIGSNDMNHTFVNEGTTDMVFNIELQVTSLQGCENTAYSSVLVHPSPVAEFSLNKSMGCSPLGVQILNTSQGAVTYNWNFGDGNSSSTSNLIQNHTYTNIQADQASYEIRLDVTSNNGCTSTFSESVTVFPLVNADFNIVGNTGCSPHIVDFENISTGANTYRWEFDDGDFSTNRNTRHTFLNETTVPERFDVLLIATSSLGCIDSSQYKPVYVNPRPNADFTLTQSSGCSPFTVGITNNTTGATSYNWFMSNGFYSYTDIASYTFRSTQSTVQRIQMELVANNDYNCPDTSSQSITLFPEVQAMFIMSPQSGCSPLDVRFTNQSTNALDFHWDFGDGVTHTDANPTHPFDNPGTQVQNFNVVLTAISDYGCENRYNTTVEVYPQPNADFDVEPNILQYPESTVQITNNTPGSWLFDWDFGDGTTLNNVANPLSHTFPDIGEYSIKLTARSPMCEDTITQLVLIRSGEIIADYDSSYAGCVPLEVKFYNKSENALWYSWDFGDGNTSTLVHPGHTYEASGTYVVELTAGNSIDQKVSRKHTVTVYPEPKAAFTVAPEIAFLPNAQVSFYNQSDLGVEYLWYFGNGESSSEYETTYFYEQPGTYDVSLVAISEKGCVDSLTIEGAVTVNLQCELIFPNAFTPSETEGTGKYNPEVPEVTNDIFHPVYQNILDYKLQIFNRWGELIFESNDINLGWNGYYHSVLSKQDTYVWQVEATCLGGNKIYDSGSVTLMR